MTPRFMKSSEDIKKVCFANQRAIGNAVAKDNTSKNPKIICEFHGAYDAGYGY
ncbi:MAG: hypothetical protein ACQETH_13355 [Candidatus Rifleibacteriota bacterium]